MTEAEWLACEDPSPMLEFLRGTSSDRKLRLFAVACCRRVLHCYDDIGQNVIEVAERVADSVATSSERRIAVATVRDRDGGRDLFGYGPKAAITIPAVYAAESGSHFAALNQAERIVGPQPANNQPLAAHEEYRARVNKQVAIERSQQAALLRDIFGNPFRPVTFALAWRTSDVTALAVGIYAEKAFDRLPILADALQDAGCESDDVLSHLRSDGTHVKGCWALDLVLGKS